MENPTIQREREERERMTKKERIKVCDLAEWCYVQYFNIPSP